MAEIFQTWKQGDLDSYLIEITAAVLRKTDSDTGKPLVDVILDEAEQKGTGRWAAQSALELGVPVTAITEAVYARSLSAQRAMRLEMDQKTAHPALEKRKPETAEIDAVRDALYASKIIAYAQGFEQMSVASAQFHWDLKLGDLATIWRGGCIIRARFLDRIKEAYDRNPKLANLLLDDYFRQGVARTEGAWRRVLTLAVSNGVRPRRSLRRSPITTGSDAPEDRRICCRACATISAPTPIAARQARQFPYALGPGRGRGQGLSAAARWADQEGAASRTLLLTRFAMPVARKGSRLGNSIIVF